MRGSNARTIVSDGSTSVWKPILVQITEDRIDWQLRDRPKVQISFSIRDVIFASYVDDENCWKLSVQSNDFPPSLRKYNPGGVTDHVLGGLSYELASQINDLLALSRGYVAKQNREVRLRLYLQEGLSSDLECPMCGAWTLTNANCAECHMCDSIFSNAQVQPVIEWNEWSNWAVVSTERWMPLFESDLPLTNSRLIWIAPPSPGLPGPLLAYHFLPSS